MMRMGGLENKEIKPGCRKLLIVDMGDGEPKIAYTEKDLDKVSRALGRGGRLEIVEIPEPNTTNTEQG